MDKCTREEMRPYDGAPAEIRSQYEKVWLAAFPLGYLPVEETFVDGQICRRVLSLEEARELQKLSREERWKREYYKGKLK